MWLRRFAWTLLYSLKAKRKKTGEGEEGSLDLSRMEGDIVRNLQAWLFGRRMADSSTTMRCIDMVRGSF